MKPSRMMRKGFLALALLATSLVAGCNTYHYFDIDVEWGPVTSEQASQVQLCVMLVSGADSYTNQFASSANQGAIPEPSICPPDHNYPKMGTFEYSTFTDSGQLTFAVNGYKSVSSDSNNLCTTGSTSLNASSEITQMGTITMGNFDTGKCPSMITQP